MNYEKVPKTKLSFLAIQEQEKNQEVYRKARKKLKECASKKRPPKIIAYPISGRKIVERGKEQI